MATEVNNEITRLEKNIALLRVHILNGNIPLVEETLDNIIEDAQQVRFVIWQALGTTPRLRKVR